MGDPQTYYLHRITASIVYVSQAAQQLVGPATPRTTSSPPFAAGVGSANLQSVASSPPSSSTAGYTYQPHSVPSRSNESTSNDPLRPTFSVRQPYSTSPALPYHYAAASRSAPAQQPQTDSLSAAMESVSLGPRQGAQSATYPNLASGSAGTTRSRGSYGSRTSQPGSLSGIGLDQAETSSIPARKTIGNTSVEEQSRLDPRFTRRPRKFFRLGRVFKVHWPEPGGYNDRESSTSVTELDPEDSSKQWTDQRFGETFYSKIRWFVVVKSRANNCTCVPINTYRGQGVSKTGVDKSQHAIAYTHGCYQVEDRREAQDDTPMRRSICIVPDVQGDILDSMSRIDYARVYTVEHNVKAMNYGLVHPESERELIYSFREVFLGQESDDSDGDDTDVPKKTNRRNTGETAPDQSGRAAGSSSRSVMQRSYQQMDQGVLDPAAQSLTTPPPISDQQILGQTPGQASLQLRTPQTNYQTPSSREQPGVAPSQMQRGRGSGSSKKSKR